ncbi:MAG TPA: GTP-binding protein [Stellaceae bacterium]|jgi:sulfate adenylyltransferase large subunit
MAALTAKTAEADIGVLRFSTAGSVDDGKSSLIGRMLYDSNSVTSDRIEALERAARRKGETEIDLSLLMDGLTIEREQGITIDVAYSYFATPQRKFIIADTPGHEQYTRNMVTGASTADAAVILIDARRGMTLQTRRHLYLSHLLGVAHLVIAVNKMDLVAFDQKAYAAIARSVEEFTRAIGAERFYLVPISAKFGDNVVHGSARMPWYEGKPLLALLETLPPAILTHHSPFRFPVQLVQRLAAPGGGQIRQYLGRVESGRVRRGDEIAILPGGRTTRVRAISTFEGALDHAEAGKSIALEVDDEIDIGRGDLFSAPLLPARVDRQFAATVCWFADETFTPAARYLVKCGTRTVAARIAEIVHRLDVATLASEPAPETLKCNDIAKVSIALASPLAFDAYDENRATGAFILIDADTNATVAAGMIAPREDAVPTPAAAGFDAGL